MLPENIIVRIRFEMKSIADELQAMEQLFQKIDRIIPDPVELRALAGTLHAFYNGVEKIFEVIARHHDGVITESGNWHKGLLSQMTVATPNRGIIISMTLKDQLEKYMAFRHYYRHAYGFNLDWELMKNLCLEVNAVFEIFKDEISKNIQQGFP